MPPRAVSNTAASTSGVIKHAAGAFRAAAIAVIDAPLADVNAVGAGHAHRFAGALDDMSNEASGCSLAVYAGDGDKRDAAVVAIRIEHVDYRLAYRAGNARRRLQVHAQGPARR